MNNSIYLYKKRIGTLNNPWSKGWDTRRKLAHNQMLYERLVNVLGVLIGAGLVLVFAVAIH